MENRFRLLMAGGLYQDAGLLALRITVASPLLIKHGLEKVFSFSSMAQHFPDPIHIGPLPSLVVAMLADFVCTILMILGLATRWAALFSFCNLFAAWAFVHNFSFFGEAGGHGELIVVYMGVMLALILAGAGKYSLDYVLVRSQ
jgi:putative oxidoreductase